MNAITENMLMSYLDGELSAHERHAVESTLDADPQLRERLAFLQRVERSAASVVKQKAPAGLTASIMSEVHVHAVPHIEESAAKSNRALYLFLSLIAGFMAIVVFTPSRETVGDETSFMPSLDWLSQFAQDLGSYLPNPAAFLRDISFSTSDTMLLVIGSILLLTVFDLYVLRPLSRKNGH